MAVVKRVGPPEPIKKKAEGCYVFEVPLSQAPDTEWEQFFGQGNISYSSMFGPRMVTFLGSCAQFQSDESQIKENLGFLDGWLGEADRLYAEELGRRKAAEAREDKRISEEQKEIAQLKERLKDL